MGFVTPRGFNERTYDDFLRLASEWVQAGEATLYYNGLKANTVFWPDVRANEPIASSVFALPPAESTAN